AGILAPGGTIWRLDHEGKNMSLVAAGFRNHFDAAFSPRGELFTFDSDMEWDEALPWYRAVRVCHCPPGADFVWRTGAANTPDYYIDSLPPIAETGRGSPVGLEFYDHNAFPAKYRGAFFMADWAIGVIFAAHLERDGASYKTKVERFCAGAPMNVTDLGVGPNGALYFTMGGRGSQGGVYRIVRTGPKQVRLDYQSNSAWGRAFLIDMVTKRLKEEGKEGVRKSLTSIVNDNSGESSLGARLVLQRIDPKQWADRLFRDEDRGLVREGIIALCKTGKAAPYAEQIFARLHETSAGDDVQNLLDHLRTMQMALVHTDKRPGSV